MAPRAKHFLWILSHNGVKTYDHLFRLNLGLQASCVFCSLEFEMVEHLMFSCSKTQIILTKIEAETGKNLHFLNGFTSGNWLSPSTTRFDLSLSLSLLPLPGLFGKQDAILSLEMRS